MTDVKKYRCCHCNKEAPQYRNYCSWKCQVDQAKQQGCRVHTPNNLPILCIKQDGTMLEHTHGDHPDYKFPVEVEYVGTIDPDDAEDYRMCCGKEGDEKTIRTFRGETHALIYTDGTVAVTMYEYCYATWLVHDGSCSGGSLWNKKEWKLAQASLDEIKRRFPK